MPRLSDRFMQLAVLSILVGMGLGVVMGKNQDFTLAPAHAHLNLLGWVSMFLFGLFYRVFPQAAARRLAAAHFITYVPATFVMVIALAFEVSGDQRAAPILAAASVVVAASMVLFALVVFGATSGKAHRSGLAAQPAE